MKAKENISDEDINDMIEEYKTLYVSKEASSTDCQIVYKGDKKIYVKKNLKIQFSFLLLDFIAMLQQ